MMVYSARVSPRTVAILTLSLAACSAPEQTLDSGPPPIQGSDGGVRLDAGTFTDMGSDLGTEDAGAQDLGAQDMGVLDQGEPDMGAPDLGSPDLGTPGSPDQGIPCQNPPSSSFEVSSDVVLCAGSFQVPGTMAAMRVVASNVNITCLGTILENTSGFGSTEAPTVGILLDGVQGVTIEGCGARGYRYGLVAQDASGLELSEMELSDNFTDPSADWVQDSVQGGGIRFERVTGSTVISSRFARNWNGIELRDSDLNVIVGNTADHCSNTGATLVDAHDNTIQNNDMSWGIRGANLSYPSNWYGVDTKDSAGIIVDSGSSQNRILNNDFTYGGDGVFIRSVIGGCAPDNLVEDNDTSYSPHNAIECWCDDNRFINNIASDSHYGIWLGGTDRGVVRGNTVERNIVDGISIQIGEDRHSIIENNQIANNGRVGVLLTGREVQVWHNLSHVGPNLANSSHLLVQNNTFASNGPCAPYANCDVFIQSSRAVTLASNCNNGELVTPVLQTEAEGVWSLGQCNPDPNNTAPTAELAPVQASAMAPVVLNASGSSDAEADALSFHWMVQRAGIRFNPAQLPELVHLGPSGSTLDVTFPSGGLWDIAVTVNDGLRAGMAHQTVAVAPGGLEIGATAAQWGFECTDPVCATMISDDPNVAAVGAGSVLISTQEPFLHTAVTPPGRNMNLNASNYSRIGGFFRAENNNPYGWQGNFPTFVLGSSAGTITLTPDANLLPLVASEWIYVEAPLLGGQGWTRTQTGSPNIADVDFIEVHTDTWDFGRYNVWVDALSLF